MPATGWCIEKIGDSGNLTGLALDIRILRWVSVSQEEASFRSKRAAEIYAEENGLVVGCDVLITEHVWE